jgi:hypothetical protein
MQRIVKRCLSTPDVSDKKKQKIVIKGYVKKNLNGFRNYFQNDVNYLNKHRVKSLKNLNDCVKTLNEGILLSSFSKIEKTKL